MDKYTALILQCLEHHLEQIKDSFSSEWLDYHSDRADYYYDLLKKTILPEQKNDDELPFNQ